VNTQHHAHSAAVWRACSFVVFGYSCYTAQTHTAHEQMQACEQACTDMLQKCTGHQQQQQLNNSQ
jgi:hypothetical protein